MDNKLDELMELIKHQQDQLHKHHIELKRIKKWTRVSTAVNFTRLMIVLVPLVLALVFIPRYLPETNSIDDNVMGMMHYFESKQFPFVNR